MSQGTRGQEFNRATMAHPLPDPFSPGKDLPAQRMKCLACGGLISQNRHMGEGRFVVEWKYVNCGRTIGNDPRRGESSEDPPIEHYRNNLKRINGENWRAMPAPTASRKKKSGESKDPSDTGAEPDPEDAILSIAARVLEREESEKGSGKTDPTAGLSLSDLPEDLPDEGEARNPPFSDSRGAPVSAPFVPKVPTKAGESPGHEVRRRRKALGLTIPSFAKMVGKKPSAISFLESRSAKDTPAVLELKGILSKLEKGKWTPRAETIDPAPKKSPKTPAPSPGRPSKEISKTRRNRLEILCGHFGNPNRLAKQVSGIHAGNLWKILNEKVGMGDRLARKLEGLFSLPEGWMDGTGPVDLSSLPGAPIKGDRTRRKKIPKDKTGEKFRKPPAPSPDRGGEAGTVVQISRQSQTGRNFPADIESLLASLAADPNVSRIDIISVTLKTSAGSDGTDPGLSP